MSLRMLASFTSVASGLLRALAVAEFGYAGPPPNTEVEQR